MTDTGAPTTTDTDRGARRLAAWLLPALALAQVALVLGADLAVRGTVEQLVAGQLAAALEADEADVEVAIGGVSVLAQGLTGSVDEVRLRVADIELGRLAGELEVTARTVPFDPAARTGRVSVRYAITGGELDALMPDFVGMRVSSVELRDETIAVAGELVSGGKWFLVELAPGVASGEVSFAVAAVRVAEGEYGSLDELSAHRGYGALLRALREQSRVCIADQLPEGFELTALTARDGTLVAELRAPHVRLGALSFDRLGSCV